MAVKGSALKEGTVDTLGGLEDLLSSFSTPSWTYLSMCYLLNPCYFSTFFGRTYYWVAFLSAHIEIECWAPENVMSRLTYRQTSSLLPPSFPPSLPFSSLLSRRFPGIKTCHHTFHRLHCKI